MIATFRRPMMLVCWLTASMVYGAYGQNPAAPELNLTLGEQRVKFAPTRSFQEMRLEVVNNAGETVFTHLTTEAEFDWNLRAGNGEPLVAGLYSYVLTLKFEAEQAHQHRGNLIIEKDQQQVWLTTQDGATVSGSSLNAVRSGGRSIAGLTTAEGKSVKRDMSGREVVGEKGNKLPDSKDEKKSVKQEKAALLGTTNKVAKFGAGGVADTDSSMTDIGHVIIDSSTNAQPAGFGSLIIEGQSNKERVELRSAGATPGPALQGKGFGGTIAAPTATLLNTDLFIIGGSGHNGSGLVTFNAGTVKIKAEQTWTMAANGSYINFETTPSGSPTSARAERMRITGNGNVGIGTITPTHKLDVAGIINTTAQYNIDGIGIISGSGTNLFIGKDANGFCFGGCFNSTAIGVGAIVGGSNTVALGRAQDKVFIPGQLSVSGNARFDGDLSINGDLNFIPSGSGGPHLCYSVGKITDCSISSARYKKNITSLKAGLAEINRLRPVNFTWKKTDEKDFGLIAEEVAVAAPLLTVYDKDGTVKGVNYDKISVVLVNAVKEQQAQIQQLLKNNRRLSQRVAQLERKGSKQ